MSKPTTHNSPSICYQKRNPLPKTMEDKKHRLPPIHSLTEGKGDDEKKIKQSIESSIITCPTEYAKCLRNEANLRLKVSELVGESKYENNSNSGNVCATSMRNKISPSCNQEKSFSKNFMMKKQATKLKVKAASGCRAMPVTQRSVHKMDTRKAIRKIENMSNRQEQNNVEQRLSTMRVRNEDQDDASHRDRYLSAMEDLFRQQVQVSTRTTRSPQLMGNSNTASILPGRRIQAVNYYPEDPMMKLTGRHVQHSFGFKSKEKSDSIQVEPDHETIEQVNILYQCEQELFGTTSIANRRISGPTDLMKIITQLLNERRDALLAETTSHSLSAESEKTAHSELDRMSSRASTLLSEDDEKWINTRRVYFHFNPVVQIYPHQTPWRSRSYVPVKRTEKPEDTSSFPSCRSKPEGCVMTTKEASRLLKRVGSVDQHVQRSPSADIFVELQTAFRAVYSQEFSLSHLDSNQTLSSLSSDRSSGSKSNRLRRIHSETDLNLLSNVEAVEFFPPVTPIETEEKFICSQGGPKPVRIGGKQSLKAKSSISFVSESTKFAANPEVKQTYSDVSLENIPLECRELFLASTDPNPMTWFDLLDERLANADHRKENHDRLSAQFHFKGLAKRFIAIPNGLIGLQQELQKGWDIRPKPELLMKCLVKKHVLKMPISVPNSELVENIYQNSIVRHPGLYKLLMRRRELMPQELQQFLNRIMELTETSERQMATLTNSVTKLAAVTTAAKEMDASGFMTGGPKLQRKREKEKGDHEEDINGDTIRSSQTGKSDSIQEAGLDRKDAGYCSLYGKETDFDKGFYTTLRNPCANILEEVALYLPEFAWHIRPLFESLWASLDDDLYFRLVSKYLRICQGESSSLCVEDTTQTPRSALANTEVTFDMLIKEKRLPNRYHMLRWPETYEYCRNLFTRVTIAFATRSGAKPGDGTLRDLLICIHMSHYYNKLSNQLVKELDAWIPYLLSGFESPYSSVREETCCTVAYLVCAYRLMTKLHVTSKNLLVANMTLNLLSAIGRYPQSYPFYHGVLGYILHAIPCVSIVDCLLLWLPTVENDTKSLVARDWALYVYYMIRHWPRNPFFLDTLYQKRLVKPLETSLTRKHARRQARLALSYLVRKCNIRSALLTCWPENEEISH